MELFSVKNESGKVIASGFANKQLAKAFRDENCTTTPPKDTGVPVRKPNLTVTYGKDHFRFKS